MTPEEWYKVKEVLQTALELDPPARGKFLDAACVGQDSMRSEVESLLESHDEPFLEQPVAIDPADLMADTAPAAGIGRRLGHYELLEQIGEGGTGASENIGQRQAGIIVGCPISCITVETSRLHSE